MHKIRLQPDGSYRDSDNWQLGIPKEAYMKSLLRHVMELWLGHRRGNVDQDILCACLFNVMGYLLEDLKDEEASNRRGKEAVVQALQGSNKERPSPLDVPPQG